MTNIEHLHELFLSGQIDLRRGSIFETTPAALPEDIGDRVEGMVLGLAVGDALGNTSEGLRPHARRAWHGEIRHYLPNPSAGGRAVGLPSDDTQLAFWTLEQILEDGGLVPEHLARRFASGRIFGIGQTVTGFLRAYQAGTPWYVAGPRSAGNGALMRIAPVLVPHLRRPSPALWADTALCAMMTHNDSASTAACVAFVRMLWDLLAMRAPPQPEWWLQRYVETARDLELDRPYAPRGGRYRDYRGPLWRYAEHRVAEAWAQRLTAEVACEGWYSGAFLFETVPSVLYILMRHGHDPEEAIVRAANDTQDNDTVAAIVGAAVGALHGRNGLPERWIGGLLGRTAEADDGHLFEIVARLMRDHAVLFSRHGQVCP